MPTRSRAKLYRQADTDRDLTPAIAPADSHGVAANEALHHHYLHNAATYVPRLKFTLADNSIPLFACLSKRVENLRVNLKEIFFPDLTVLPS